MSIIKKILPVKRVTEGPQHHFFGYFDKFPWDKSGRYLLTHETNFTARQPEPGEKAGICLIDLQDSNKLTRLAETSAWCWQQGSMLQWVNDSGDEIIFNDREGDSFVSRIMNINTGKIQTLCRPVYCLSPDGKWALSLNFSRLDTERPGYGYPGLNDKDKAKGIPHPDFDGVWLVDIKKNSAKLIISVDQIVKNFHRDGMDNAMSWFNHMLFSPDSKRFAFFHRWRVKTWHLTHMFTANIDGSDIYPLNLEDMSSHYTWINDSQIINFSNRHATGWQYHLFTDRTDKVEVIAKDVFPGDGHCSYSSDSKWMLTDSYPAEPENQRKLFLYNLKECSAYETGSFYADPAYPTPTRCDLHPNWSRDNSQVCIDSIHEGTRQVYIVDVSGITKN